jgi:hypothetical protein
MSAAQHLLDGLAAIGATVRPRGNELVVRAGEKPIPGSMIKQLRESKADLLHILTEKRLVDWLDRHPCPSPPGSCAYCGKPETPDATVVPFGVEQGRHTWLHPECWHAWHLQRREHAARQLAADGG